MPQTWIDYVLGEFPARLATRTSWLTSFRISIRSTCSSYSRNYRSPSNIVDMSQRLIAHNKERVTKQVVPVNTNYAKIDIVTTDSYDEVAAMVENDLKDPKMNRVAIISRKKSHLIPYQIILSGHGVNFYAAEDLNVMLNDAFNMLKGLIDIKRRQVEGASQSFMGTSLRGGRRRTRRCRWS